MLLNRYMTNNVPPNVIEAVEQTTGMSLEQIISSSRKIEYIYARMLLSKALLDKGVSKSAIGRLLRRTHGTVINYINNYDNEDAYNPTFRMMNKKVNELIGNAV